jgi:uncharacterized protein
MQEAMLTKEEILVSLRKNKDFFKKKFDVDNIMLFGSYARNEATKESDIDILIECKKKTFKNYINILRFLEKSFNKKVDVIYLDTVNPFIMELIEKELAYA